jgi:hypothetical protein
MTTLLKNERLHGIALRVPESTRKRLDEFRARMAREAPGSNPSLSDAVRVVLERGLKGVAR